MTISKAIAVVAFLCAAIHSAMGKSLYVDYSYQPSPAALLSHEVCILHPNSQSSIKEGQSKGNEFYAYLSLTEVARDATYLAAIEEKGIKLLKENEEWQSRLIDIRQSEWENFFVGVLARQAVEGGYDGFFIDTVDSFELLELPNDSEELIAYEKAVYDILARLKKAYPNKKIIINRGFRFAEQLSNIADGVLIESVFSTSDIEGTKTVPVEWKTSETLLTEIARVQGLGYETFVIDYVAPGDRKAAEETEERIRNLGSIPYVGSRKLDGTNVYEKLIRRKIMVLYGYDAKEVEENPIFAGDTLTLSKIQTPLEWMGYEFEYHNISNGLPTKWNEQEFCGVVIDKTLEVPRKYEMDLARWIAARFADDHKILFLGTGGFKSRISKDIVFTPMGITLKGTVPRASIAADKVVATKIDSDYMHYEIETSPSKESFEAFQAPKDAKILVGLQMKTFQGEIVHYDPVFLTEWGGCLLEPYASHQVSPEIDLSHVDPFKFLSEIWPAGNFPAPDVTTRQGLRAFYSHIDGDGFVSIASFPNRPYCGEVMRDRVLRDLPFPVTVSIVEAEIRGHMLVQKKPDVEKFESVSREIFEMPHIEPASHSYSHPYVWDLSDKSYYKQYASLNLPLKLTTRYPKIQLEREIGGSLDYITEKLSGTHNPPKIFLWSGNCRPSTEALRLVREAGIENMNGGNTILSRRFPGVSAVAPKLISADGEMQVFASNQNEFYYTDGWRGPFYHGFKKVIETFEMTESPRRLKPVNVYYHFYSAERQDALSALQEIYEWCKVHDLHLMTTSAYAKSIRDSFSTKITEIEPGNWRIRNGGKQQTYRLPVANGFPDIGRSNGIIGYTKLQDSWYISTDASGEYTLALSDTEVAHPHLISSTEELTCNEITESSLILTNQDRVRASKISIGGLGNGKWSMSIAGAAPETVKAENGVYSFSLPKLAEVKIRRL